jgi:hypothetical protein
MRHQFLVKGSGKYRKYRHYFIKGRIYIIAWAVPILKKLTNTQNYILWIADTPGFMKIRQENIKI